MTLAFDIFLTVMLIIAGTFGLIGSFGLLKLRQPMQRLHAPTKATTIGVGSALLASALDRLAVTGHVTWQEIMVAVFLFISAPLSALYLSKAHLVRTIDAEELPSTGSETPWAELRGAELRAPASDPDDVATSVK